MNTTQTGRTVTVALPAMPYLNSNQRLHWATKARKTKAIRDAAAWATEALRQPPMGAVEITAVIHPKTNRRFDPHNLQPTVKAAIDGIVDAQLIADDDSSRLVSVAFCAGEKDPSGTRIDLIVKEVAR
ncbi:hypothetical protein [Nocardiopsis tropica]|uniref:Uncharacterized protein n=1 Tax=Nocardiopsis tropica TaxID=109330 RepID=A0ABU7KR34_9ACTN|nr:hypothetical protein [Nocardiopsis umidischolae]MEE2051741.1 hypothetical protein [Nocardiopsis umidischolae]